MNRCPNCKKGTLRRGVVEMKETIGGHTLLAKVPGEVCDACKESVVAWEAMGKWEAARALALARGRVNAGMSLRWMRKQLGLNGKEAAELLGTTPETISRWEHDVHEIPALVIEIVAVLVLERAEGKSTVLERLREEPRRLAKRVELDAEEPCLAKLAS